MIEELPVEVRSQYSAEQALVEIMSYIKGSYRALMSADGHLSETEYLGFQVCRPLTPPQAHLPPLVPHMQPSPKCMSLHSLSVLHFERLFQPQLQTTNTQHAQSHRYLDSQPRASLQMCSCQRPGAEQISKSPQGIGKHSNARRAGPQNRRDAAPTAGCHC